MQYDSSTMPTAPTKPTSIGPSAFSSTTTSGIRWDMGEREISEFLTCLAARGKGGQRCARYILGVSPANIMMSHAGATSRRRRHG